MHPHTNMYRPTETSLNSLQMKQRGRQVGLIWRSPIEHVELKGPGVPRQLRDDLFVRHLEGRISHKLLGARTLLGAQGIATRSKEATRGSWPYY